MKKNSLTLILIAACLLAGCSRWTEGSYVYLKPHNEQYGTEPTEEPNVEQAETYLNLRTILLGFVGNGMEEGLIGIENYGDSLEQDMEQAVDYVVSSDPIGAYAVKSIDYQRTVRNEERVVKVRITFRHSREEIQSIRSVRGIANAQLLVEDALKRFADSLVLQISGYETTSFSTMISQYCAQHPDTIMEEPRVTVKIYPQTGKVRVVEFRFSYTSTPEAMESMRKQVQVIFNSAEGYASSDSSETVRAQRLYSFLMERFSYVLERSSTPSYDLLCQGKGDSEAFARVFTTLCARSGLECQTVSGWRLGEKWYWNILRIDGVYYYVDLCGDITLDSLNCRGDADMEDYAWQKALYPYCGPEEPEPTVPALAPEPEPTDAPPDPGTEPPEPSEPPITEPPATEPEPTEASPPAEPAP